MTFTGLWPVALVLLLLCNLDSVVPAGNYEHYKAAVLAHFRVDSQAVDQLVDASRDPNENDFRHYVQQASDLPQGQRAPLKFAVLGLLLKKDVDVKRSKARIKLWNAQQSRNRELVQYWRQELRECDKSERRLYQQVGYNPEREALYQGHPPRRRHSIHRSVQERSNEGRDRPTVAQLNQMIVAAYNDVLGKSSGYAHALETTGRQDHYSGADFSKLLQSLKPKLEKGRKVYEEMRQVHRTCVNNLKLGPDQQIPVKFMPKYVNFYQNVYLNSWLGWFAKVVPRQWFYNEFVRGKIVSYKNRFQKDSKSFNKLKQEAQAWERSLRQAFGILTSNNVLTHAQIKNLRDMDQKFSKSLVTIKELLQILDKPGEVKPPSVFQKFRQVLSGSRNYPVVPSNPRLNLGPSHRRHSIKRSVHERSSHTAGRKLPTMWSLKQMLDGANEDILAICESYERDFNAPDGINQYSGLDFPKLLQSLKPKLEKGRKVYEEMSQVYATCESSLNLKPEQSIPVKFMPKYVNFYQNVYWDSWLGWFVKFVNWHKFYNKFARDKIASYDNRIVQDTESLNKLKKKGQKWKRSLGQAFDILTSNSVLTKSLIKNLQVFEKKIAKSSRKFDALVKVLDNPNDAKPPSGIYDGSKVPGYQGNRVENQEPESQVEPVSLEEESPVQSNHEVGAETPEPPNVVPDLPEIQTNPTTTRPEDPGYFFKKSVIIPFSIVGTLFGGWYLHHKIPKWVGWEKDDTTTLEVNPSNTSTDHPCDKTTHRVEFLTAVLVVVVVLTLLFVGILLKNWKNGTGDLESGEASHKSRTESTKVPTTTGTETSSSSTRDSSSSKAKLTLEAQPKKDSPATASNPVPSMF